jgi:hypothetical protein
MKKNYNLTFLLIILISGFSFGQEMLVNGGLENWDSDTAPTDWTKVENIEKESTEIHGGSFSAKHTGGTKDLGQTIEGITPGDSYTITIWYKVVENDGTDARIWSYWKDDSNASVTDADTDGALRGPDNSYLPNNGGEWSKYEATVTAPAGAAKFYFELRTYKGAITYWDDLSVVKNSSTSTTVNLQDFTNLTNTATAAVYGGFGGGLTATNAVVDDPVDASNKVRTVTTTAGGDAWKGVFFRPQTHYIDLTSTKTVSVKIYSTTASYFKGKIQAGQDNQADIELATSESHGGTGWETLTFTFSDATGEYGEFVIFTNPDANGAFINPATEVLEAHFDDITADQGSEIPAPPAGPTDSPAAPTAAAANVVSIYSDAYTDITTNYNPGWGQAGNVNTTHDPGDGNNVMVYSNFNYQGTVVANTDISAMEKLHIDIWVADASVRTIKVTPILVSGSPAEFLVTVPVTSGAWNSVDIVLSDFTGLTFGEIKEIKFDGQFKADGTGDGAVRSDVYLDNIYFYKEPTATPSSSPAAPTAAAQNVMSIYSDSYTGPESWDPYPNWGQATQFSEIDIDGNKILGYSQLNYQGNAFSGVDLAGMNMIHLDVYSSEISALKIVLINTQAAGGTFEIGVDSALENGAWTSLDIPLSDFKGFVESGGNLDQLKYEVGTGATTTGNLSFYLDNIYLYKESTASTIDNALLNISMYPNPASSRLTISAQKTINSAAIYNILGKQVMSLEINKNSESIDVSNLATGMYLIKYSIDNAFGTAKFIKQ